MDVSYIFIFGLFGFVIFYWGFRFFYFKVMGYKSSFCFRGSFFDLVGKRVRNGYLEIGSRYLLIINDIVWREDDSFVVFVMFRSIFLYGDLLEII